ncbi:apolipoprotein D-like [Homarus americanus]|uniref:apolipoprotein D-like n=1 Tax=Homarus americanus TaxID=6706 RepID=UPI001C45264A|nr:apolipoprotein D-like [Homarus americanus]
MTQFWTLLLLASVCVSFGATSCPNLRLMKNFSTDKYMGVWYEIQAQPNIFQSIKSCLASSYKRVKTEIHVLSEGLDSSGASTTTKSILKIVDPQNPAHMVTDFVPGVEPPFDIVDTDYKTFSCAHSCLSIVGIKTEFVFIYSRNRTLRSNSTQHCLSIFESYGIDLSSLVNTPQRNCHSRHDL